MDLKHTACVPFSLLAVLCASLLVSCIQSPASTEPITILETTTQVRQIQHARGIAEVPLQPQRILALGEEGLLADLLDLGVRPIASNTNVADNGMRGREQLLELLIDSLDTHQ